MTQSVTHTEPFLARTPWERVAQARRSRGWSQARLAEALAELTGKAWSRDMVARLENDTKTFDLHVLVAVSIVQQRPYAWYLEGTDLESELSRVGSGGATPLNRGYLNSELAEVIPIERGRKAHITSRRA